jgi:hypothetical protein
MHCTFDTQGPLTTPASAQPSHTCQALLVPVKAMFLVADAEQHAHRNAEYLDGRLTLDEIGCSLPEREPPGSN